MLKVKLAFAASLIVCCQAAFAQIQNAASYLAVESIDFSSQTSAMTSTAGNQLLPIDIRLRNVSRKNITYVGYSLPVTYPDGAQGQASTTGVDLIFPYAYHQIPGVFSPGPTQTLNSGDEYIQHSTVPQHGGVRPVRMTMQISLLVFDDGTWLGDPRKAQQVYDNRRDVAEEWTALLDAVRSAESSADPAGKYRELAARKSFGKAGRPGMLDHVNKLQSYLDARGTPLFDHMLRMDEMVRSVAREQSKPATPIEKTPAISLPAQGPDGEAASWGFRTQFSEATRIDSPLRAVRSHSFNGYAGTERLSDSGRVRILNYPESYRHSDSLPLNLASVVARGKVTNVRSYLSEDQTTIYSELKVQVSDVLFQKGPHALSAGGTADVIVPGGVVICPAGSIVIRGCPTESVPGFGQEYLFLLRYAPAIDAFPLLSAFELGDHAYMTHSIHRSEGRFLLDEYGAGGGAGLLRLVGTALATVPRQGRQ